MRIQPQEGLRSRRQLASFIWTAKLSN